MALHMSSLFLRTLREDPADAEVPSHRLLVRAGYIRRVSPGVYTWLPLGLRVLRNVEKIVREEMDAIGAQELLFPALLPKEPFEATGRWTEYGDNIFRLQDRKGADHLLGPTHEEMFTLTVKDLYSSYKDLPLSIYQIQTKYRDEARPRAGVLRGREFVMKDSYSFDVDAAGLDKSYQLHREAYVRIFDRLGFHYVIVEAMAGAMGGSKSEEFLATAEVGEDTYVHCTSCGYAANVEAVRVPAPDARRLGRRAGRARRGHPRHPDDRDARRPPQRALPARGPSVGGRRHAQERRRDARAPRRHARAARHRRARRPRGRREASRRAGRAGRGRGLHRGRLRRQPGARQGLHRPRRARARGHDRHPLPARPARRRGHPLGHRRQRRRASTSSTSSPAATSRPTAPSRPPRCAPATPARTATTRSRAARGIEMGHVFQLGTKYAEALDLKVLDQNGKLVTVVMGSYGVGVSRAVACVVEGNHDESGIIWPRELAPADVHIVAAGKDEALFVKAEEIARELEVQGLTVLVDDRKGVSPGVKFKDSELIGVPTILVIGRGLADGNGRDQGPPHRRAPRGRRRRRRRGPHRRGHRGGRALVSAPGRPVQAVIFDWGGTLTPWHEVDLPQQWRVFARTVHGLAVEDPSMPAEELAEARLARHAHPRGGGRGRGAAAARATRAPRIAAILGRGGRRPGARPAPPGAGGIPALLGAAHPHGPAGAATLGGLAAHGDPGRRAVQHDLDAATTTARSSSATACSTCSTPTSTRARSTS